MDNGNIRMKINELIDSRSSISFVKERFIPRVCHISNSGHERFFGVNGSDLNVVGLANMSLILDHKKCNVTLRVVPDKAMQNSIVLDWDFMKLAKLTLKTKTDVTDIMNTDVHDNNSHASVEQQMRDLFEKCY